MRPSEVLFDEQAPLALAVCDHYCGTEPRMRKALQLQKELGPCFDITFDCEDGAPIGQELAHAQLVCELLTSPENLYQQVGVRVHDPLSPFFDSDIDCIIPGAGQRLAYITIPKVSHAIQVSQLIQKINHKATQSGISKRLPIHVLIETNESLADVFAIAALPQVVCLSFGLMDFVSGYYGAIPSSAMHVDQFSHPLTRRAMTEIAVACHTFGKTPAHNVCTETKDLLVVETDTLMAKNAFAYTRKWSIHPNQIPVSVNALGPTDSEILQSIAILSQAIAAKWGPIQHEGKLHDRASYRYYWTIAQRAYTHGKMRAQFDQLGWFRES